jgi:hypothetical protein
LPTRKAGTVREQTPTTAPSLILTAGLPLFPGLMETSMRSTCSGIMCDTQAMMPRRGSQRLYLERETGDSDSFAFASRSRTEDQRGQVRPVELEQREIVTARIKDRLS